MVGSTTPKAQFDHAVNANDFKKLVLSRFPSLQDAFEEWRGLVHLQVGEFMRFTQSAIEAGSFDVVSQCFEVATAALIEGDESLRNAIYERQGRCATEWIASGRTTSLQRGAMMPRQNE
jgi:hypothetical protein